MKISDLIAGNVSLATLNEKNRYQKVLMEKLVGQAKKQTGDSLELTKSVNQNFIRIQELQKNFMKDIAEIDGLNRMQDAIELFEKRGLQSADWEELNRQLNEIISSTVSNGEKLIGNINPNVTDQQSLNMLKNSLSSAIEMVKTNLKVERKEIAQFLIASENREVAGGFLPSEVLKRITAKINTKNAEDLFKSFGNLSSLLVNQT